MENFDRSYCIDECPIGKAKDKEFLNKNNSAYDAAMDMYWFVKECMKTCERCKATQE